MPRETIYPKFSKRTIITDTPKVNIALRPLMNGKYLKGFSGISFNVEGEEGESPEELVFEVLQVIENALRESYGTKPDRTRG